MFVTSQTIDLPLQVQIFCWFLANFYLTYLLTFASGLCLSSKFGFFELIGFVLAFCSPFSC